MGYRGDTYGISLLSRGNTADRFNMTPQIDKVGKAWVRKAYSHNRFVLPAMQYFMSQGWSVDQIREGFRKIGIHTNIKETK